jgi:hypothetical protein
LVAILEEAAEQFWVMQDGHQALWSSAVRVWDLVLEGFGEEPSLVVALSSVAYLIEGHIDAAAANEVLRWARLALATVLSHFPKLELELELLRSSNNVDLTRDLMEVFWTQSGRALESLSSRVHPSVARSPPNGTGEE